MNVGVLMICDACRYIRIYEHELRCKESECARARGGEDVGKGADAEGRGVCTCACQCAHMYECVRYAYRAGPL
jgi:hypothetical protein